MRSAIGLAATRSCRVAAVLALFAAGQAGAREPYGDAYFVKRGGDAARMFQDRETCTRESMSLGGTASAYSNPQYGALSAMGQALDSDALHDGGLRKRMGRAVLDACMKRLGWARRDLGPEDKAVSRASVKKPQALDAWITANAPAEPVAEAPRPAAAQPAAAAAASPASSSSAAATPAARAVAP